VARLLKTTCTQLLTWKTIIIQYKHKKPQRLSWDDRYLNVPKPCESSKQKALTNEWEVKETWAFCSFVQNKWSLSFICQEDCNKSWFRHPDSICMWDLILTPITFLLVQIKSWYAKNRTKIFAAWVYYMNNFTDRLLNNSHPLSKKSAKSHESLIHWNYIYVLHCEYTCNNLSTYHATCCWHNQNHIFAWCRDIHMKHHILYVCYTAMLYYATYT
jgi:hypothetical protein